MPKPTRPSLVAKVTDWVDAHAHEHPELAAAINPPSAMRRFWNKLAAKAGFVPASVAARLIDVIDLPDGDARPDFATLEGQLNEWLDKRIAKDPSYAEVRDVYKWAKRHHTGVRDNGEPEFIHQVRMCLKTASFIDKLEARNEILPEGKDFLKALICHDMLEDKAKDLDSGSVMNRYFLAQRIGGRSAEIVFNMSRKYINPQGQFVRKTKQEEHADMLSDPLALLGKHIDRDDNLNSMADFTQTGTPRNVIYTPEKAKEKIHEAIHVLLQSSLPDRVESRYGSQWLGPMRLASNMLCTTIENVIATSARAFTRRTILHPTDYGVTRLVDYFAGAHVLPEQSVERASKKQSAHGAPAVEPDKLTPPPNAPGSRGAQGGNPQMT